MDLSIWQVVIKRAVNGFVLFSLGDTDKEVPWIAKDERELYALIARLFPVPEHDPV